jgi:leucyl aminopeptidase
MKVEFVAHAGAAPSSGVFAAPVFEGSVLSAGAHALDAQIGGGLVRAMTASGFTGAKGRSLDIVAPAGTELSRVLLIGVGAKDGFDAGAAETTAAEAYQALKTLGVRLAAYRFDRYRTKEKPEKKPTLETVRIVTGDVAKAKKADVATAALANAITFSRDLVSEPANILYPEEFARRVKALEPMGLKVEILDEAAMAKLGMNALLGVGRGSVRDSQLAVIQWKGAADSKAQPLAFVGKGVCFDTGGISLKSPDGMEDMKWDMGGAAAVAGLMHVLAGRKAKVNAIGILGLVENMPDGAAQRPGDIVTSMSGQTIEVINTDAEGRLVLADALWYCQQRFKPKFMIDLATLTGAIIVALGNDYAGLFSNNDDLSDKLLSASKATGENLWRFPMPSAYERQLDSLAADMKNVGARPAGSITAALFIQKFVNGLPWAHLDIASTAWKKPSSNPTIPDGASGFGVRLLDQFVADHYEG